MRRLMAPDGFEPDQSLWHPENAGCQDSELACTHTGQWMLTVEEMGNLWGSGWHQGAQAARGGNSFTFEVWAKRNGVLE